MNDKPTVGQPLRKKEGQFWFDNITVPEYFNISHDSVEIGKRLILYYREIWHEGVVKYNDTDHWFITVKEPELMDIALQDGMYAYCPGWKDFYDHLEQANPKTLDAIIQLLHENRTLDAIMLYKKVIVTNLKDAMDGVEGIKDYLGLNQPD